ncbi:MAG: phosphotransferase [bacterium]|nr:phosphotransferase [bacterium]
MAYPGKLDLSIEALKASVQGHYGLEVQVWNVRNGYMSTTVVLQSQHERYVLKVYRKEEVDPKQIEFGLLLNDTYEQAGLPVASRFSLCEDERHFFVLWRHLEGRVFSPGALGELEAAGQMLGQIHMASPSVSGDLVWPPMWDEVCDTLVLLWGKMDGMDAVADWIADFQIRLARLQEAIRTPDLETLPRAVIHGDYRAQNLLFREGQVVGILDLDTARGAPRLFDLAYALVFFQAVIAEAPLDLDERGCFLKGYNQKNKLSERERDLLPDFLELALMRGLTLWMQIAYLDRVNASMEGWFPPYLDLLSRVHQWAPDLAGFALDEGG